MSLLVVLSLLVPLSDGASFYQQWKDRLAEHPHPAAAGGDGGLSLNQPPVAGVIPAPNPLKIQNVNFNYAYGGGEDKSSFVTSFTYTDSSVDDDNYGDDYVHIDDETYDDNDDDNYDDNAVNKLVPYDNNEYGRLDAYDDNENGGFDDYDDNEDNKMDAYEVNEDDGLDAYEVNEDIGAEVYDDNEDDEN